MQQPSNASKKSEKKTVKRGGAQDENPEDYVDPETPVGDKKRMSQQLAKQYSPAAVEKSWVLIPFFLLVTLQFCEMLTFYVCHNLGGTSGGRNQIFLWQMLTAPNHLLLL